MRRILPCIETHTCGEPTRILTVFNIPGPTMMAKQEFVRCNLDHLRQTLIREPRGHQHMFGAILTAPVEPDSICGVIWFDNQDYLDGCGHATIGVGVALVESGMVPLTGPDPEFCMDAPSGRLSLRVKMEAGIARETSFRNVPAFSFIREAIIDVPGIGRLTIDIAYGGNFFGIVKAQEVGIEIAPENMSRIAALGLRIREAANRQLDVRHPVEPKVAGIRLITFIGPSRHGARYINTHVFANGAVDRSPGGTGTSALLAHLHASGELRIGEEITAEGIAGGLFRGRVVEAIQIGGRPGIIPEVTGSAFITGYHQFIVDPMDPFARGFAME